MKDSAHSCSSCYSHDAFCYSVFRTRHLGFVKQLCIFLRHLWCIGSDYTFLLLTIYCLYYLNIYNLFIYYILLIFIFASIRIEVQETCISFYSMCKHRVTCDITRIWRGYTCILANSPKLVFNVWTLVFKSAAHSVNKQRWITRGQWAKKSQLIKYLNSDAASDLKRNHNVIVVYKRNHVGDTAVLVDPLVQHCSKD